MSTDPSAAGMEDVGKKRKRKLLPSSSAGCASVLTFLFLCTLVVTVWVVLIADPDNVPLRHSISWLRVGFEILLVVSIPLVLYRAIRLWMEGEPSRYPDINYAWKAGVAALESHGMSLTSAPLYLVLGSNGEHQEKALLQASGMDLRVEGVPEGPAPLHWYANPEAIYLFCTETSWTSALAALNEIRAPDTLTMSVGGPSEIPVASQARQTTRLSGTATQRNDPAPAMAPAASKTHPAMDSHTGTIMLDQFVSDTASDTAIGMSADAGVAVMEEPQQEYHRGTMMFQTPVLDVDPVTSTENEPEAGAAVKPTVTLTAKESANQIERLNHVCDLLRRARSPLCPANGILTMIPFDLLQRTPREFEDLTQAVKADLATVQRGLQLRCPVISLIVGLEKERGFRELVRRVGRVRSANQRFGQKFDLRTTPTPEELAAFGMHVSGAFEDWVYTLFREEQALTRPGNMRLYGLLCKVRCTLKKRLSDLLAASYGFDAQGIDQAFDGPVLFSGCYFAATGRSPDRQAFVKGVLEKLVDEQEFVEWTEAARDSDSTMRTLALAGTLTAAGLTTALAGMMAYKLMSGD